MERWGWLERQRWRFRERMERWRGWVERQRWRRLERQRLGWRRSRQRVILGAEQQQHHGEIESTTNVWLSLLVRAYLGTG